MRGEGEGAAEGGLGNGGGEVFAGGVAFDDGFVEGYAGGRMGLILVVLCVVLLDRVVAVNAMESHDDGYCYFTSLWTGLR